MYLEKAREALLMFRSELETNQDLKITMTQETLEKIKAECTKIANENTEITHIYGVRIDIVPLLPIFDCIFIVGIDGEENAETLYYFERNDE